METYLAILRGINVSGQKKVNMNELKILFETLKCSNIKTYIQSGNVVFNHNLTNHEEQVRQIEKKILEKYGFQVPVLIRSRNELMDIVDRNPFMKEPGIEVDKLHITFLSDAPNPVNSDKIQELKFGSDRFIVSGNEIYVYCPGGYGNTKLSNTFFENKLKVTATTRNWKTVNELLKMAESVSTDANK